MGTEGSPLTDADRAPWIEALVRGINERQLRRDVIVACSALSTFVRDRLRAGVAEPLHFILLNADRAIIQQRLALRPQHLHIGTLLLLAAAVAALTQAGIVYSMRKIRGLISRVDERIDAMG
jgi:carbohydrate kinase (thermoresistant glucokinase family)